MVNIGGRSKGCTPCRKRRVKCDETRPICQRCERGGLPCDGPRDTAFITGTIVKSRRKYQPTVRDRSNDARKQDDRAVQPVLHREVMMKPNVREISICYTRTILLPNGPIDLALQNLKLSDIDFAFIKPFQMDTSPTQPVNPAALSFAMVYFGTKYHQPSIIHAGYILHGHALALLNRMLSSPSSCTHDNVILSVVTLAMLECLVPTGPRNYLKHMLGLERLLALRSPASLVGCSPVSSRLYKGVRHMVLFASLRAGRPSVLARREWKAALRAHCNGEEQREQDLYDVLADCTVLLAGREDELSGWKGDESGLDSQQDDLECKAMTLLATLRQWKARWDCDAKNAYLEDDCESQQRSKYLGGEEYTPSFPTILRFASDSSARILMLYNTTLIYVLRIFTSMSSARCPAYHYSLPLFPGDQHEFSLWNCIAEGRYSSAQHLAALEVARCIPDHLSRKRVHAEGQFVLPVVQWAITTASAVLGGKESVEGRWMMQLSRDSSGQVIADGVWESRLTPGMTDS